MAQIQIGNFGYAEPNVQPTRVQAPNNANLRATQQLGDTVAQIGFNDMARQAQERDKAERERLAEAKQAKDTADRAAAITGQIRAQNGIDALSDELSNGVRSGSITADDARKRWSAEAPKVVDSNMDGVPDAYQPVLRAQSEGWLYKGAGKIDEAGMQRSRSDTGASLNAFGEEMQRAAIKDINGATQRYESALDQLGPQAGLSPEQIQKAKQGFRENTRYTQAYNAFTAARDNTRALNDVSKWLSSDQAADIDPQKKAALQSSIDTRIATLEQRAAIQADTRARQATQAFGAFAQFMDSGRVPTPEYSAQALASVRGTPYEASVRAMLQQAPEISGFAAQPLDVQRRQLQADTARMNTQGSDPAQEAAHNKRETAFRATETAVQADPLVAGLDRNVIPVLPPLNVTDLATLPQQLAVRQRAVQDIQTWAGRPVSPFTKAESEQVGQYLSALPAKQRAEALRNLSRVIPGGQMMALSSQLGEKDGSLGTAAALSVRDTTIGRNVGQLYLEGKDAIAQNRVKIDDAREKGIKAQINTALQGVYNKPQAMAMASEAAYAVYGALKAEGTDDVQRAIDLVTGGIKQHNGGNIAKPYGWSDDKFNDWLKTASPAVLEPRKIFVVPGYESGVPASQLAKILPGARLRGANQGGTYYIEVGNDVVRTADRQPFILDMSMGSIAPTPVSDGRLTRTAPVLNRVSDK